MQDNEEVLNLDTEVNTKPAAPSPNRFGLFLEFARFVVIAAAIVVPIRLFVASPFIVSGASMDPTFATGHYLIIDQISYRFEEPARGDVVVFKYPNDPSKYFIKRVIGLPGDTVSLKGGFVTIKNEQDKKGYVLSEPYITHQGTDTLSRTLHSDEYFVLGDNRPASSDSRIWGPLPRKNIVGRAILRLLPPNEIGIFPGAISLTKTP